MTTKIVIFLILTLFAVYSLVMGFKERYRVLLAGKPENRFDGLSPRFLGMIGIVAGQRRLLREPAGIMHILIFWGLSVFTVGIIEFVLEGLFSVRIPFLGDNKFFNLIIDVFGLAAIAGMLASAYRRYIARVQRLGVGPWEEEKTIMALIVGIVLLVASYFVGMGSNAAPGDNRYSLAPVTGLLADYFSGMPTSGRTLVYDIAWWLNVLLDMGLLVFFRYSRLVHPLAAPLNIFFRNLGPRGGSIRPLDLEDETVENYGVSSVTDFTWKQLLDCYACAECGRCQDNCPAFASGKPLSPKKVIGVIKENLPTQEYLANAAGGERQEAMADIVGRDAVWSCTTCYACQEHCPNMNEHVNKIIDLRRYLVLDRNEFPSEVQLAFSNMERNHNPWGIGWATRADWAKDMDVPLLADKRDAEYLLYVGCAGSFDSRALKVTVAFVKILQAAGINFAILGNEEKCCGDSARKLGNEYLFRTLADENIALLNECGVMRIITICPHGYNTLKNEYPALGGHYEVIHHTQFLARLIGEGKIGLAAGEKELKITYHDSCYIGRYNGGYDDPRSIITSLPGVSFTEMKKNRERAFCCGAGGGRMWMEEKLGKRINRIRTGQALEVNPQIIAVNCPFCLTMIEDGLKELEVENIRVMDLGELVAAHMPESKHVNAAPLGG